MSHALTIRYFAVLRERFECAEETIDWGALPASPTVDALWSVLVERHPSLEDDRESIRVAVNRDFVEDDAILEPGDEVALIPPVSGGSGEHVGESSGDEGECVDETGRFAITPRPLEVDEVAEHVRRDEAGAVVSFEGNVRNHTGDREVEVLVYETYLEMALEQMVRIADEVESRWPEVRLAAHHRYGRLAVGETAVVVAASSPHRPPAFEATRHTIECIKEDVPIWKKEIGPDGEEWIGGCG
jgi:molybdopterin synthase catalytic subunit